MPGDGVSLPTSLAQMGNVAKTQARGQQTSPQVTPFSEQKDGQEELRVKRVKETDAAEKSRVTRDDEEKDKRKRRRLKRRLKKCNGKDPDHSDDESPDPQPGEETLGALIDLRV